MAKRVLIILTVLVVLLSLFSGCGASTSKVSSAPDSMAQNYSSGNQNNYAVGGKANYTTSDAKKDSINVQFSEPAVTSTDAGTATAIVGTGAPTESVSNVVLSQRKVIRNANVSVEVENFDKAYGKIQSMIEDTGYGYIQESSVNKEKRYVGSEIRYLTKGIVIVRVDADRFKEALTDIRGLGTVMDMNEKSDDVTDKFYDIDSQLRLLKYEQSRLEEYLNKITDPDTIFKTESRLTDIRHQIEEFTGTLNKLSSLVKLSTITINLNEKDVENIAPVKEKTYWEKLSSGFSGSFKGIMSFCAGLLLVLGQALPVLVFLGFIGLIIFLVYKKFNKKDEKEIKEKEIKEKDNDDNV